MEYSNIVKNDVKFITIAEYGAMGNSGEIELLLLSDNKFTLYSGNMCYGEKIMDMEEFNQAFPEFKSIKYFQEDGSKLSDSWIYMNLGFGNHLYVSSDIYNYFKILIDYVPRNISYPYRTWKTCAVITLSLLEKGLLDNNILETIKELDLEQDSDTAWDYYIEFINKLHKDYKEVSLNKKENPSYIESVKLKAEQAQKETITLKIFSYICDIFCVIALVCLFLDFGVNTITENVRYSVMCALLFELILLSNAQSIPKGYPVLVTLGILHNPLVLIGTSWTCWSIINIITIPIIVYCVIANHTNTFNVEQ